MSCGKDHATPCSQASEEISLLIDNEQTSISISLIEQHLAECSDCCEQRDELLVLKSLIHRACCRDEIPSHIRLKIETTIIAIQEELPGGNS